MAARAETALACSDALEARYISYRRRASPPLTALRLAHFSLKSLASHLLHPAPVYVIFSAPPTYVSTNAADDDKR
ncbi:hypothetical protein SJAG_00258 [Schizosaccharomyces japonicus yFS275]|uniref:Uncharacterized protein n=1 Tax=Schizosaccharomyces japonicus (strain yFS275 / FY16936) TaxID=402676 RepID=B6JV56_SCHJY|nr:hypothetical protein SJAG_00258 [Schizosaccharomyces japonicus yFS275]EEB05257.1 hypothetical protein SJAG_00258 [Schizosaccharomyces japonicus yFS275]